MKFFIEQLALAPENPEAARELLEAIGATVWSFDKVRAQGRVFGEPGENVGNLAYNYQLNRPDNKPLEVEILSYSEGPNWLEERPFSVSHLGMHCTEDELVVWRSFFAERGISIAQEVQTQEHTNPLIKDSRRYVYVIFDTRSILGVDLKFIVRKNLVG
jgi:hypothetical protein